MILVFANNILQWLKDKVTVLLFCFAELFSYLGVILIIGMDLLRNVLLFERYPSLGIGILSVI